MYSIIHDENRKNSLILPRMHARSQGLEMEIYSYGSCQIFISLYTYTLYYTLAYFYRYNSGMFLSLLNAAYTYIYSFVCLLVGTWNDSL